MIYLILSRKEFRVLNTTVLTVGSVTYAMKARKLLLRGGIRSKLVKVNGDNMSMGCNHGLEIDKDDFYSAAVILKENRIAFSVFKG